MLWGGVDMDLSPRESRVSLGRRLDCPCWSAAFQAELGKHLDRTNLFWPLGACLCVGQATSK